MQTKKKKGLSGTVKLVKPVKKTSEKTAEKKTSASKKSEPAKKTSAKKVVKKKAAPVANATAKA